MKKETIILCGHFFYFLIFLIQLIALIKYPYEMLAYMDNNLFVYTVYCLVVGMGLWFSTFDLIDELDRRKNVSKLIAFINELDRRMKK